jgi:hypothetical protein
MNWFKSLFCKHEYEFVCNIYGDQINYCDDKRSIWKCKKCGNIEYRDKLYNDKPRTYKLCNELDKLYDECYDKRYKDWQLLRSESLNMMQKTMRDNAYDGQCWADFILVCEEKNNDRNYYEKWLTDNDLRVEIKLYNQKEINKELNTYEFHVRWKYRY